MIKKFNSSLRTMYFFGNLVNVESMFLYLDSVLTRDYAVFIADLWSC
jgi:hypothetical protein